MRTDGSGLRNLTRNPATDSLPTWSPVLRRLAFQSDRDGENALYSMRADGSDLRRLAATPADGVGFHWSPDGTRFVFLLPAGGPREIRVMDSGGTGVRNLSGHDATLEYDPAWSPDGTRVAFTSNRNGPRAIFAVDAARGEVMQLIAPVGIDESAAWSPDGRQLAFSSRRLKPLDIDIYVADLGGANTRNISQTPDGETRSTDHQATWSPDGRQVAFARWGLRGGDDWDIFTTSVASPGPVNVTSSPGYDASPVWFDLRGRAVSPVARRISTWGWLRALGNPVR